MGFLRLPEAVLSKSGVAAYRKRLVVTDFRKRVRLQTSRKSERDLFRRGETAEWATDFLRNKKSEQMQLVSTR